MTVQQSLVFPMYQRDDMDAETLFAKLLEIGYSAVEFHFRNEHVDDLIKRARDAGLAISSICGHRSLQDGLNKTSNHDRIEAELQENIDFAAQHDIPGLICFTGNRNPHQSDAEGMDATVAGLQRIAPYAERKGVTLNIELLNSKIDHPGYLCDHTARGAAICERVQSPSVKLLYDIYHMQIMEGDLIRNIREHIRWIGHFHTAGNPGRSNLDDTQEINYPAVCQAIADTGYTGYIAHEFRTPGDPVDALQQAYHACATT